MSAEELTDDEYTVLMIAAQGDSMMAIGRWEQPTDALVQRGLMRRLDKFNNLITAEGRAAMVNRAARDDRAFADIFLKNAQSQQPALPAPVPTNSQLQLAGDEIVQLVINAARTIQINRSISMELAVRQVIDVVLRRSLEVCGRE